MLGGHLDSWHAATGATDNAIGCATMIEADPHPAGHRRQAAPHDSRGAVERRGAGPARLAGLREGALRHVREPEAGVRELRRLLQHRLRHRPRPRHDRVRPARGRARSCARRSRRSRTSASSAPSPPTSRRRGGTDHTSFNEAGLPGIGVQQDPIEYQTHTWHTNLDTYERIIEDDARQSAIVIAAAVYHLAMRDEQLPRLPKDKMPALPTP